MNPHVRQFFRLLAVVVCVGLLTAFMVWALKGAEPSQRRSSFDDERHIAYRATPDVGPVFSLDKKSGIFRIQSFLHLPTVTDPSNYEPERRYKYGLAFLVRDGDGEVVERRTTWLTTRNSKADWRDGRWQKAGSYYPVGEGEGEPCDSRLTTLDLQGLNDADHTVEVRMLYPDRLPDAQMTAPPAEAEVNLLVYRRFDRAGDQRKWRRRTLSRKRRTELASRAGLERWHQMTESERDRAVRFGWKRISTISDTPLRALYQTGFRMATESLGPQVGEPLRAGEKLAYNLAGPGTLHVGLLSPPGGTDDHEDGSRTVRLSTLLSDRAVSPPLVHREREVTLRAADTTVATTPSDLPPNVRTEVEIAEGQQGSIRLTLDEGRSVRVMTWLEGEAAPLGRGATTRVTDRFAMTGPDWASFHGWEANASDAPVEFVVGGDNLRVGEAARISARPIVERGVRDATESTPDDLQLIYEFTGGEQRRRETIDLEPSAAPFERLDPSSRDRSTAPAEAPVLGQPSYHRIWIPEWAERLRIEATGGRAVVDLSTLPNPDDYPEPKLAAPYVPPPDRLEWRYALHRVYPWQTLEPSNAAALFEGDRRRRYDAQVRLRPNWDSFTTVELEKTRKRMCPPGIETCRFAEAFDDETDSRQEPTEETAVVVRPDRTLRSGVVVERSDLQPDNRPNLHRLADEWSGSWRLGLRGGRSVRCRPPDDGRLAIDYRLADQTLLGETLEIRWQGATVTSTLMRVDRDRLVVDVPSGHGRLELRVADAAGGGLRAYANCRPLEVTDAATVWRFRQAQPLSPGESMTVPVYTGANDAPGLNVVAYPSAGLRRFDLNATVDGGDPPRRTDGPVDQLTDPSRTLTFEVPGRAPNRLRRAPDTRLAGPVRQFVPLGSDWQPGWHDVELSLPESAGGEVWLRFFLLTPDAQVARRNREGNE